MRARLAFAHATWAARHPSRARVVMAVALAHGLLALAWQLAMRPTAPPLKDHVVWLQGVREAAQQPVPKPTTTVPAPPSARAGASALRTPRSIGKATAALQPPAVTQTNPLHDASAAPVPMVPPSSPAAGPAASAAASADNAELLINREATRRAVRLAALERSTARQARDLQGQADAPSAQERLGQAVKQAGRGDCLKGEFAGAGLGLLSLPFLLAAELMEKCSR